MVIEMSGYFQEIKSNNNKTIGDRLLEARNKKGLTQEQLRAVINVKGSQISKIESAQATISAWQIIELVKSLNISVSYLLGEISEEEERKKDTLRKFEKLSVMQQRVVLEFIDFYYDKYC